MIVNPAMISTASKETAKVVCYPIWTDRMKVYKNIIAPGGRIARPLGVKAQCDYCKVGFSFITGQVISVSGGLTMHG